MRNRRRKATRIAKHFDLLYAVCHYRNPVFQHYFITLFSFCKYKFEYFLTQKLTEFVEDFYIILLKLEKRRIKNILTFCFLVYIIDLVIYY